MTSRIAVGVLAAVSATSLLAATPALAAGKSHPGPRPHAKPHARPAKAPRDLPGPANPHGTCGTYPPGQTYQLTATPQTASVTRHAIVKTTTTLTRGEACAGYKVGLYTTGKNPARYTVSAIRRTDGTGTATAVIKVQRSMSFLWHVNVGKHTGASSVAGTITVA